MSVPVPIVTRILRGEIYSGEEWRSDTPVQLFNSFSYMGIAKKDSNTAASIWDVIRFSYDGNGNESRKQYRTQIAWDNRASGW